MYVGEWQRAEGQDEKQHFEQQKGRAHRLQPGCARAKHDPRAAARQPATHGNEDRKAHGHYLRHGIDLREVLVHGIHRREQRHRRHGHQDGPKPRFFHVRKFRRFRRLR